VFPCTEQLAVPFAEQKPPEMLPVVPYPAEHFPFAPFTEQNAMKPSIQRAEQKFSKPWIVEPPAEHCP
jgi:hypothetical protein